MNSDSKIWDVIVIGGGPAGMMTAITASKNGKQVLLLEKNSRLGEKLLITGGGRCNVTNNEFVNRKILPKYKEAESFLYSPFSQFAVKDTLEFFHSRGVTTKVENEGRVFPITDKAETIWHTLTQELIKQKVTVESNITVKEIMAEKDRVTGVLTNKGEIKALHIIIATGGKSRPETGSTGDGFVWLRKLGHNIVTPEASLVPLAIKDQWVKDLQGITLPEVKITLTQFDTKQKVAKGKILFTHFGVTGPTILNMSKSVSELLSYGDVFITLDLLPTLDHGMLNKRLQEIFTREHNKKIKNSLDELFVGALTPIVLAKSGIDADKKCNSITKEERMKIIEVAKNMKMQVEKLLGTDKAIITSGGIDLSEVDTKTMSSKRYPNLKVVGDVLNIDRPSGGYSLQLCWTTGFVAGNSIE